MIRLLLLLLLVLPLAAEAKTFGSYSVVPPAIGSTGALGTFAFAPSGAGSSVTLLHPTIVAVGVSPTLQVVAWQGKALELTFDAAGTTVHVTLAPKSSGATLETLITADVPIVSSVDYGAFPAALDGTTIPVPYYSGTVTRFPASRLFANAWFDWKTSAATQEAGSAAQYLPRTDGTLVKLHETLVLAASPTIGAVLPWPGNAASPYRAAVAGAMVVDIWGGSFASIAGGLATLGQYGVRDCVVIIHDWQHLGYDNGLPDHLPANAALGGDAGLAKATAAARANGCRAAVHENYIDYYPDDPSFDPAAIALDSSGDRILSWLNPSTGIQSFATKPSWMVRNAETQSPTIHARYGTGAAFLDVDSSVVPWFYTDMDSKVAGAGQFTTRAQAMTDLWAYLRKTHDGPVLGEGDNHWYWSGLLDGAEAQFGAGAVAQNIGAAAPLFVNFDLTRMHALQVNHGMGYYERWTVGAAGFATTEERDAYRMQEVAFGHAPFLGTWDWTDASRAMTESALVGPVARRYGLAQATEIKYRTAEGWVGVNKAAEANAFSRVKVTYDDGLRIVANAASSDLAWNGVTLPPYGWAASAPGFTAYSALCDGVFCDYAQGSAHLFANARNQSDIRIGMSLAGPSVAAVASTGQGSFDITYDWHVYEPIGLNLTTFVHFVDDADLAVNDGIVFQGDHIPAEPTSQWEPGTNVADGPWGVSIPNDVADGTYSIRVGLYDPASGTRYPVAGDDDGTGRIIIGYLKIADSRRSVTLLPPPTLPNDPRLNASGSVVTFPAARTDGMMALDQEAGDWVLHVFPRFRAVTVELAARDYARPAKIVVTGGTSESVVPVKDGAYWKIPLVGGTAYRWAAGK